MLKCARSARGRASRHTLLYITITDYCNLGNTAGLESGLKTQGGGTGYLFSGRLRLHSGHVTRY